MIRKMPVISSAATAADIMYALKRVDDKAVAAECAAAVGKWTGLDHIYLAGSGITAYYMILKALAALRQKDEVILSAYTAGSLVVAVRKAGLKVVLCDTAPGDCNADVRSLVSAVSERTLAVTCVHMFGIGMKGIAGLREALPKDVYIIEDCAQSMGTGIGQTSTGRFGDVSIFSFNRGKNLPACGGGFCATRDPGIAARLDIEAARLGEESIIRGMFAPAGALTFSAATNPYIYGPAYGVMSLFREKAPPRDLETCRMSSFHAALVLRLLTRADDLFARRYRSGMFLLQGLKGIDGLTVPSISAADRPVFNQFPVVFADASSRVKAQDLLARAGIDTSRMYQQPLHHMFDLGYARDDFPNACYFADRMLTLPVHPAVRPKDLDRMVGVIRKVPR